MYLEMGQRTSKLYGIKPQVEFEKNYEWDSVSMNSKMVKNKDKYRGRSQEDMKDFTKGMVVKSSRRS